MSMFSKESRAAMDDLMEKIIEEPSVPEFLKIGLRISKTYGRIRGKLDKAYFGFNEPSMLPEMDAAKYPARKEFLEYLLLMEAGLDSFLAAHPAPPCTRPLAA